MTGQTEAREQIAEWLFEKVIARDRIVQAIWPNLPEHVRANWLEWADELLATPAVAEALAAIERVRAFVDGFAERGGGHVTATDELWIMSIRRCLDGPT